MDLLLSLPDVTGASGAAVGGSGGCIRTLRKAHHHGARPIRAAGDLLMVVSREVSVLLSSTRCRWKEENEYFYTVLRIEYFGHFGILNINIHLDLHHDGAFLVVSISERYYHRSLRHD